MPRLKDFGLSIDRDWETTDELISELKYKEGSIRYFPMKDYYDRRIASAGDDPLLLNKAQEEWARWKTNFFATNPIFAERIQSQRGSERRRDTLQQMRRAVNDPITPDSEMLEGIGELIRGYDKLMGALEANKMNGRSADNLAVRRRIIDNWNVWIETWKKRNSKSHSFYESVIKREIEPLIG